MCLDPKTPPFGLSCLLSLASFPMLSFFTPHWKSELECYVCRPAIPAALDECVSSNKADNISTDISLPSFILPPVLPLLVWSFGCLTLMQTETPLCRQTKEGYFAQQQTPPTDQSVSCTRPFSALCYNNRLVRRRQSFTCRTFTRIFGVDSFVQSA